VLTVVDLMIFMLVRLMESSQPWPGVSQQVRRRGDSLSITLSGVGQDLPLFAHTLPFCSNVLNSGQLPSSSESRYFTPKPVPKRLILIVTCEHTGDLLVKQFHHSTIADPRLDASVNNLPLMTRNPNSLSGGAHQYV
jgi:hypothetical protein